MTMEPKKKAHSGWQMTQCVIFSSILNIGTSLKKKGKIEKKREKTGLVHAMCSGGPLSKWIDIS